MASSKTRYVRFCDEDSVDPSVWEHWQRDAKYRPKTLVKAKLKPPGV